MTLIDTTPKLAKPYHEFYEDFGCAEFDSDPATFFDFLEETYGPDRPGKYEFGEDE